MYQIGKQMAANYGAFGALTGYSPLCFTLRSRFNRSPHYPKTGQSLTFQQEKLAAESSQVGGIGAFARCEPIKDRSGRKH
jgi:hypothetical protein